MSQQTDILLLQKAYSVNTKVCSLNSYRLDSKSNLCAIAKFWADGGMLFSTKQHKAVRLVQRYFKSHNYSRQAALLLFEKKINVTRHDFPSSPPISCAADILSAVSFDQSGEYFATGDRGGRVVIFKKSGGKAKVTILKQDDRLCTDPLRLTAVAAWDLSWCTKIVGRGAVFRDGVPSARTAVPACKTFPCIFGNSNAQSPATNNTSNR